MDSWSVMQQLQGRIGALIGHLSATYRPLIGQHSASGSLLAIYRLISPLPVTYRPLFDHQGRNLSPEATMLRPADPSHRPRDRRHTVMQEAFEHIKAFSLPYQTPPN